MSFNKEANVDALAFHLYWLGAGKLWRPFRKNYLIKSRAPPGLSGRGFYAFVNAYTKASRDTPLWITEAGGMYGSGGINVTSSYRVGVLVY